MKRGVVDTPMERDVFVRGLEIDIISVAFTEMESCSLNTYKDVCCGIISLGNP
jgi:hypothetical protein